MQAPKKQFKTIDEYIAIFPQNFQEKGMLYGKAYGDMYLRGKLVDKDIQLNCSGCYQWQLVNEEEI